MVFFGLDFFGSRDWLRVGITGSFTLNFVRVRIFSYFNDLQVGTVSFISKNYNIIVISRSFVLFIVFFLNFLQLIVFFFYSELPSILNRSFIPVLIMNEPNYAYFFHGVLICKYEVHFISWTKFEDRSLKQCLSWIIRVVKFFRTIINWKFFQRGTFLFNHLNQIFQCKLFEICWHNDRDWWRMANLASFEVSLVFESDDLGIEILNKVSFHFVFLVF